MITVILEKKGKKKIIGNPVTTCELLGVCPETIRRWYRARKLVVINGYNVSFDVVFLNNCKQSENQDEESSPEV